MTSKAGNPKAGRAQTLPGKTNTGPVCHNPPRETKETIPPKLSLGPTEFMELQKHRWLLVSYITEKPHPSVGNNSRKPRNCCPHSCQSSLLNSVHCAHRLPSLLGSVESESPLHPIQIYCSPPYPPASGAVEWGGGASDLFLSFFCGSDRIFISEFAHCLPQPRSRQEVGEEGNFKQRQTM